jgi:ABC-type uncharacterized transport system fused permease/ATPase subunit
MIQMRMRCRQPVLIQGDTGVGKTALLRNLCKILQWELHVLDVHGGLTVSNRQSNCCNASVTKKFSVTALVTRRRYCSKSI